MKPKVANPLSKNGQNSLLSIYIDWSFQPLFRALIVLELDTSGQGYKTAFILPSTNICMQQVLLSLQVMKMQRDIKGLHIVSSEFYPFLAAKAAQ